MEGGRQSHETQPAIRAVQTQSLLTLLGKLPPADLRAYQTSIDPAVEKRCRDYRAMAWVPLTEHMHLCVALWRVVGRERFVDLFRETFLGSMRNPLLQGIFGLINTVSSDTITMLLRNAPRIYGHVTRDTGVLRYERLNRREATLALTGYPPDHDMTCWVDGTHGSILGAMEGVGARAGVRAVLDDLDERRGTAHYRLFW